MRLQLARPDSLLIGPDLYDQLFTMHGSTMMFLFAVPVMEAFAVYLVPLMVGTRNIAFPRLNAFSYWIYLAGGILLWTAFAFNTGADNGWFSYVPLAGPEFAPGKRADIWAQMITFTELSALAVSIEIICTVFKQRAPGMTLDRIPLFVWAMVVTSFIVLLAMPAVMLSSTMLILDRLVGTHFFNPAEGGDTLLVAAPFLVLWSSRSLHDLHSRYRDGLRDHRHLRPAADLRLPRVGARSHVDWHPLLRLVGASHVHHRPTAPRREFLHRLQHDDRHTFRRADLLLDCDPLGTSFAACHAATLRLGIHRQFRARRADWRHGGFGAARHASARYLFRRGSLPLRPGRRRGLSACSARSIIGSPRLPDGC